MLQLVVAAAIAWQVVPAQTRVATAQPFEAVAVKWSAGMPLELRVRVSDDGEHWSEWTPLAPDDDLTVPDEGHYLTGITHFGSAKLYLEYDFSGPADAVVLTFFPPRERRVMATQSGGVRLRTEWGCPDGEASRWTPAYTNVTHAVVHHTAYSNDVVDWEWEVRDIWYLHTFTNGWGDIGYNFLIDPNGVVYEGRAGGRGAVGAHFSCKNSNTVGISLLGNFMTVSPTPAALDSLKRLLAAICSEDAIDPTATRLHPSSGLNLPTILGHRDGNVPGATCTVTECPGDVLYSMLPAIRSDVAASVAQPHARRRAVTH